MATKYMTIRYTGQFGVEQADGTYVYTGTTPDYTTLFPLLLSPVLDTGSSATYRDSTGTYYYGPSGTDSFLYDDSNEAAILACYGATGYAFYQSFDISYYGIVGTEPTRIYV